jgi:hypothetical protein
MLVNINSADSTGRNNQRNKFSGCEGYEFWWIPVPAILPDGTGDQTKIGARPDGKLFL